MRHPHATKDLTTSRGNSNQAFTINEIHNALGANEVATLLNDIHITTENDPILFAEILSLARCSNHPLVWIHNAHISRGSDDTSELIGALLI